MFDPSEKIAKEHLLYFYARYKFINDGPCNTKRPSYINFEAKAKWDSWNSLKKDFPQLTIDMAKQQYCDRLDYINPGWSDQLEGGDKYKAAEENGTFGVRMSAMVSGEDDLAESDKTCFDLCKEGSVEKLKAYFNKSKKNSVNQVDENKMTFLMWACDRGSLEMVQYLVDMKADLNMQDTDGQTALHYAASCEHVDIVKFLLKNKDINIDLLDSDELTASQSTDNKEIADLFENLKL